MAKKYKSVMKITKSLTKKGKLKGSNKKETKLLNAICPHHKMNKKGKIVPTIFNNGDYCVCQLCGEKFPAIFYTNDNIGEIVGNMEELNNQNKFMAVATNAGDGINDFFTNFAVQLMTYKKNSKKLRNIAEKQGSVKEKKKRRNNGSNMYGSWGNR